MKKTLFLVALVMSSLIAAATPIDEMLKKGREAYAKENYEETIRWLEPVIGKGTVNDQYILGVSYREAVSISNYDYAEKYLMMAAKQNHADAQAFLAWMYEVDIKMCQNDGNFLDRRDAYLDWYRKAASNGNHYSQMYVGFMELGCKNYDKAIELFSAANKSGRTEFTTNYAFIQGVHPAKMIRYCELIKSGIFELNCDTSTGYYDAEYVGIFFQKGDTLFCEVHKGQSKGVISLLPDGTFPLVVPVEYDVVDYDTEHMRKITCDKNYYSQHADGKIMRSRYKYNYSLDGKLISRELDYSAEVTDKSELKGKRIEDLTNAIISSGVEAWND